MPGDRVDELLSKISDLKTSVDTHIALTRHELKRSEDRHLKMETEIWGPPGRTEGVKSDVDRLNKAEEQRKWIVRGIGGSTIALVAHAIWKVLKP